MSKLITLIAMIFLTFSLFAKEVALDLPINGEFYGNKYFPLKKYIKDHYPRIDFFNATINEIEFEIQSRYQSIAIFKVGNDQENRHISALGRTYNSTQKFEKISFLGPLETTVQERDWSLEIKSPRQFRIHNMKVYLTVYHDYRSTPYDRDELVEASCSYRRKLFLGNELDTYQVKAKSLTTRSAQMVACDRAERICKRNISSFLESCEKITDQ